MNNKLFVSMCYLVLFLTIPAFCMNADRKEDFFSRLPPKMQIEVLDNLLDNKDVSSIKYVSKYFNTLIKNHPRITIKISLKLDFYDNRTNTGKPTGKADISYYCGNKKTIFLGQLYAETPHGVFEKKEVKEYILALPSISGKLDWIKTNFWLIRRMETGDSIYWLTAREVNIWNYKALIFTALEKREPDFETFCQWIDYPR